MPLGCLLGPSEAVLDGLGPPKTFNNRGFFKVFANAGFRDFEALDGPLGAHLGPSWADLVPKWVPKWPQKLSKQCPKTDPKNDPKNYRR